MGKRNKENGQNFIDRRVFMVSLVEGRLGTNDVSSLFLTQSSKTKWPQKKQRRSQFRRTVVYTLEKNEVIQ